MAIQRQTDRRTLRETEKEIRDVEAGADSSREVTSKRRRRIEIDRYSG